MRERRRDSLAALPSLSLPLANAKREDKVVVLHREREVRKVVLLQRWLPLTLVEAEIEADRELLTEFEGGRGQQIWLLLRTAYYTSTII